MSFGGMLDEGDGFSVVLLASFPKSKWRTLGLDTDTGRPL